MTQRTNTVKCENDYIILEKSKSTVYQTFKMLGKGYFLITLIGILSFSLLFFILWFM